MNGGGPEIHVAPLERDHFTRPQTRKGADGEHDSPRRGHRQLGHRQVHGADLLSAQPRSQLGIPGRPDSVAIGAVQSRNGVGQAHRPRLLRVDAGEECEAVADGLGPQLRAQFVDERPHVGVGNVVEVPVSQHRGDVQAEAGLVVPSSSGGAVDRPSRWPCGGR